MLINVDDDKLRKIADTLRTLSSSRIKISHSDLARFIIGETTREIDCSPQNFARVLADLLDRPISEPYVSKTSGMVCAAYAESLWANAVSPRSFVIAGTAGRRSMIAF